MTLTALVVAHNEEEQLGDCLAHLRFADEILVVLDRCTDKSKAIAEAAGARILEGAWIIEGDRRNTGIDACTGRWILEVDADERIPAPLADEVRAIVTADGADGDYFWIPFDNYVGRRLVRYGWGAYIGSAGNLRLFRKGAKRWGQQRVHPSLDLTGTRGPDLTHHLQHYLDRDVSDMIRRLDRYSTAHARDLRASGDIGGFAHNVRRIFARFYKCYVRRKGYKEGPLGFTIALCAGLYPFLSYVKARYDENERD